MFQSKRRIEKDVWYTIPEVRVRMSGVHGKGLFATKTIPNGTLIERSPLIICDTYSFKCLDDLMGVRHIVSDYPFKWNRRESAIALGYGSIINHSSDNPNALFKFNYSYPAIEFYARRTIQKDEEILMQYVPDYNLNKLWFETGGRIDNITQKEPKDFIGFTCGAFDLMHAGHIQMLEEAKQVCEYLIVGVQEDPSVDRCEKNQPIQSYSERITMVSACRYVDEVITYKTESDLYELLQDMQPNVRIIGSDWQGKNFTGHDLDIKVHFNSREHTYSTSELRMRVFKAETKKEKDAQD